MGYMPGYCVFRDQLNGWKSVTNSRLFGGVRKLREAGAGLGPLKCPAQSDENTICPALRILHDRNPFVPAI